MMVRFRSILCSCSPPSCGVMLLLKFRYLVHSKLSERNTRVEMKLTLRPSLSYSFLTNSSCWCRWSRSRRCSDRLCGCCFGWWSKSRFCWSETSSWPSSEGKSTRSRSIPTTSKGNRDMDIGQVISSRSSRRFWCWSCLLCCWVNKSI